MRIPAALFPFCSQLLPFVKQFEELQDKYVLRKLVSPSGLGLAGRDAGYSRNHPEVGVAVTDTLDPDDPAWDVLMLIGPTGTETVESTRLEIEAERAVKSGKSVLYFDRGSARVPKRMWTLSNAYPGMIHIHAGDVGMPTILTLTNNEYDHLDAPVVFVGGLVEEADTSDVLLGLMARLQTDGLCVTAVGKHPIGKLFGIHTLGHVFDRRDLTEAQKIRELNAYFKTLEIRERPSVIIVEAPDALMRYNDFATSGFGIRTYMVCQAVCPDFLVCCVPCDMANVRFLDALSSDFERRLGSPIHAVHISNLVVDAMDLMQTHSISHIHADMKAVLEQMVKEPGGSSIPMFDIVGDGVEGLCAHLREVVALAVRG